MRFTVDPALAGERLDKALARLVPDMGLRARQRLCARGVVLVDGRPGAKGNLLREGQVVELAAEALEASAPQGRVAVVARQGDYLALAKPSGMHSASVAGGAQAGVEDLLPGLAPGFVLLNRLDFPTSGLLLAGSGERAAARFRTLEAEGRVEKTYYAVVLGEIAVETTIANALDTAGRSRTRVLDHDDPDPARHTRVAPVRPVPGLGGTLVKAVIHRGARHQIRAHLARLGHPIARDSLYGPEGGDADFLYLHHARIAFPGFEADLPPDWGL